MKLFKNLNAAAKEASSVHALKINVKTKTFPSMLLDFTHLKELHLDGLCEEFPDSMPAWENLRVLSIKWPAFNGDISALFSLPSLENLKIIDTPFNSFKFPLGFTAAPLKSLTAKNCEMVKLPEEISMLEDLTELNLSGNKLAALPKSFIQLEKLMRLNLDDNNFSEFPDAIKSMPKLGHLSIDGNNFPDEEKARIHREFHIWVN
jgi:internalin A